MKIENLQLQDDALQRYSRKVASLLINNYFDETSSIEGKEILRFSPIRQVNLLIIKVLSDKWEQETARLKSPFFDYEASLVKQSLQNFMNILSQHIKVEQEAFIPLVEEAVRKALLLALSPIHFLNEELDRYHNQMIKVQAFTTLERYLHFNKDIFKLFYNRLLLQNIYEFSNERGKDIFADFYAQQLEIVAEPQELLMPFAELVPITLAELTKAKTTVPFDKTPKKAVENPLYDTDFSKTQPLPELPQDFTVAPFSEQVEIKVEPSVQPEEIAEKSHQPSTLNDAFGQEKNKESLVEKFQQAKLNSLRSALSLNQKFLFIQQLFKGDAQAFEQAIGKLDACNSLDEARYFAYKNYFQAYEWEQESEAVQSFWKLLERRF